MKGQDRGGDIQRGRTPGRMSAGVVGPEALQASIDQANRDGAREQSADISDLPPQSTRYPDYLLPFAGRQERHYERFDELREELLADYGYNTARAYWGDLDDLYYWAWQREKDVLNLSERELTQYFALLRRRKYSENTIRRKRNTIRRFRRMVEVAPGK